MDPKESATDAARRNLRETEELLRRSKQLLAKLEQQIEKSRQIINQRDDGTRNSSDEA